MGMSQPLIITGLMAKRAEVSGIVSDLEERTRQTRADLAHIDATIRLFDPNARPEAIPGKRPASRNGWFAAGEISRRIRDDLREAREPIAAEAIVRRAMVAKGLDPEDKMIRQQLNRSFLWALHRMQVSGTVQKTGNGLGAKWGLPQG